MRKAGLKYNREEFDCIFDDKLKLLPENNMRDGLASVMENGYVKRSKTTKIQYLKKSSFFGTNIYQYLPSGKFC